MQDTASRRLFVVSLVLSAIGLASFALAEEPRYRLRDLATRFDETKGATGTEISQAVGFDKPVRQLTALEYKVQLVDGESPRLIDPKTHQFKIGDRVRLVVEPYTRSYLYVYHIGASGKRTFLWPIDNEKPEPVAPRKEVTLPSSGWFEFVAPPGDELVLLVAAREPVKDLELLAGALTKPPEGRTAQETAVGKTIQSSLLAHLKSAREQEMEKRDKLVMWRGLPSAQELESLSNDVRGRGVDHGTLELLPEKETDGTCVMYVSTSEDPEKPTNLLVTIPLQSRGDSEGKR
ncbi:MAG: DUF4384 domain-containing protein [Planctomycetota bacterium]